MAIARFALETVMTAEWMNKRLKMSSGNSLMEQFESERSIQ